MHDTQELKRLRDAYALLEVPVTATAPQIKARYRRLAKQWHPDLFPPGSSAQARAKQRMPSINAAFDLIRHAPLRYHASSYPRVQARRQRQPRTSPVSSRRTADTAPFGPRTEFWIRFLGGALGGALLGLSWLLPDLDRTAAIGYLVIVIGSGLGTARWGSRFWETLLRWWWI